MSFLRTLSRNEMKRISAGFMSDDCEDDCDCSPCGCCEQIECSDGTIRSCCSTEEGNCSKSEDGTEITCGNTSQSCLSIN